MFEIGQYVRIKEWGEMESEFGLNDTGNIVCPCVFTQEMEHLCGEISFVTHKRGAVRENTTIYTLSHCAEEFIISEEMLAPVDVRGFRVGDYVKIKSWADMAKEFEVDSGGHIVIPGFVFVEAMKKYCGLIGKIAGFEWSLLVGSVRIRFADNPVLESTEFRFSPYMIKKSRRVE